MSISKQLKRVTTASIAQMKQNGEKIAALTAYDYTLARLVDEAGIDFILVGDSASNVISGHETTLPITLDQMIYHGQSVVRAVKRGLVVVDLPFGSFQGDSKRALESAIRIMKETGAHAVKMEGGESIKESVIRVLSAGIPVVAHLGLTPQSIYQFGTYSVRAKEQEEAEKLKRDAILMDELGCFAMVFEKIPAELAGEVTKSVNAATIGIGAGPHVDGQILVLHDILGLTMNFHPRFLRRYMSLDTDIKRALGQYVSDVRSVDFPNEKEQYSIKNE